MRLSFSAICLVLCAYFVIPPQVVTTTANLSGRRRGGSVAGPVPVSDGPKVSRNERWSLMSSEFGEISTVKISDGKNGCYHLHFITMYPRSLFLPAYLHSEMLFYVNSGHGTLSWINLEEDDKLQQVMLQRGDVYRLPPKTVFYIQNNNLHQSSSSSSYDDVYQPLPQPLEIYAIFPGSEAELHNEQQLAGAYIGVHDLVLGFDNNVLQSTLGVPELVIEQLRGGEGQPLIVEAAGSQPDQADSTSMWDVGSWGLRALLGTTEESMIKAENKKKTYNIFNKDRDVVTCYGWSVTVTEKELDVLKYTDFGVFMVNLTMGSMMGPHWNPNSAEVAIVLQGEGMIEVVCPSIATETGCQNSRFRVEEGDVFVVPRYHPMAQISFNNDSFVFMGFMLKLKKDESAQYLTGKLSILQKIEKSVLARSFNVNNMTIDQVLRATKKEKVIYECVSCAEEEVQRESEERGRGWQGRGGGARWPEEERGGGGRGWQQKEGGGRSGWQEEEGGGGEIARMEDEEMQRMEREAEEAVARGIIGATEEGGR